MITILTALKSTQKRPSFLVTRTTGDDQGLLSGSMTLLFNILVISSISVSLVLSGSIHCACLMGCAVRVLILCCILSVLPRSSADFENTSWNLIKRSATLFLSVSCRCCSLRSYKFWGCSGLSMGP